MFLFLTLGILLDGGTNGLDGLDVPTHWTDGRDENGLYVCTHCMYVCMYSSERGSMAAEKRWSPRGTSGFENVMANQHSFRIRNLAKFLGGRKEMWFRQLLMYSFLIKLLKT